MSAIQSYYPEKYKTYEQRKAAYESRYDENGNMLFKKAAEKEYVDSTAAPKVNSNSTLIGYAVERVGDDYVVFTMNPAVRFGGGRSLTSQDATYLREKYNMDNLSAEDRIKLLAELSCMGIVDGRMAYAEAFPEKTYRLNGEEVTYGSSGGVDKNASIPSDESSMTKWIEYYLRRAQEAQDNILRLVNSPIGTGIGEYVAEREAANFYSSLARAMQQLMYNP